MQAYGNLNGLKKNIEEKYSKMITNLESHRDEKIKEIKKERDEKIKLLKNKISQETVLAARMERARISNEEKLRAKIEFEKAREELIERVFDKVKEELPKFAKSKKYKEFIEAKTPKEENLKMEKTPTGVRFFGRKVIYDFALESMIDANKARLRGIVVKELFGE